MKTRLFLFLFLPAVFSLSAQSLVESAKADFNTYLRYYAQPLFEANMVNFADGWSHQAKTLKPWHFKVDLMANYTFIPEDKQAFTFNPSEYAHLYVQDTAGNVFTTPVELPTFAGTDSPYELKIEVPGSAPGTYNQYIMKVPRGFKEDLEEVTGFLPVGMPGVMLQVRGGLPLSLEGSLRFFPNTRYGDTEVGLLGFGLKHDIGKYLFKKSDWHLAVLGSYTNGHITVNIPEMPDFKGVFKLNIYNFQIFGSYDKKFISFYGSIGAMQGTSSFVLEGQTEITYNVVNDQGQTITTETETVTDPINLNYQLFMPKASVGVLLNLKILHIFAQYNLQQYSGLHAGISVTY